MTRYGQSKLLSEFKLLLWDFDGVIKESVQVKSEAFERLFQPFGAGLAARVREHHEAHGGMSRFEKIPRYLEWAGEVPTPQRVHEYCEQFARIARQGVINALWVPGAEAFLRKNPYNQVFALVSATPQDEMLEILAALDLRSCFAAVYGAPTNKRDAVREILASRRIDPQQCLMIGDARADWDAARANRLRFLLRRHRANGGEFERYTGDSIEDFTGCVFAGRIRQ